MSYILYVLMIHTGTHGLSMSPNWDAVPGGNVLGPWASRTVVPDI